MYERHGELLLGSHASLMDAVFFFFNDTATTEIYTLSLHDALPFSTALTWPLTFLPRGISVPSGAARSSASLALKCLPCCSRLVSSLSSRRIRKVVPSGIVCGGTGALADSSAASGRAASAKTKHQSREGSVIIGVTSGFPIPEIGCARQREMLPVSCRTEEHVREA